MMEKQRWMKWGIPSLLLVLLILALPPIIDRWSVEVENNTYEIVIPYEEIHALTETNKVTLDQALSRLREAGVTTISIEPSSLKDFADRNLLSVYNDEQLFDLFQFSEFKDELNLDWKGYYVTVPENTNYQSMIVEFFDPIETVIAGVPMYFIPESDDYTHYTEFGYDEEAIETIKDHGYSVVLRAQNHASEVMNQRIVDQMLALKDEHVRGILGSGNEFIGFGDADNQAKWPSELSEAGYYFYSIEGHELKGQNQVGKLTNYAFVRLLSININEDTSLTFNKMVDQAIRAVKERNIRSIFYHIDEKLEPVEALESTASYAASVHEKMPDLYQAGTPNLYKEISIPAWSTLAILLAGVVFTYIVLGIFKLPKLQILGAIFMLLLAVVYFVINRVVVLQGFALIIAVITPIYALLTSVKHDSTRWTDILKTYLKAIGISFIGIYLIIGLLNGNMFITGFQGFRGVKLVYVIPIAVTAIWALWMLGKRYLLDGKDEPEWKLPVIFLNMEIRVWHLVILLPAVALVAYFYISRTGNFGFTTGFELAFRQWLEDTLFVRPRTKEFLIGFPFFVLALYVTAQKKKWASLLFIPAVIGLLSIVNTFSHLHIPIFISLLRTFYSVVIGFIIGLLFIYVYNLGTAVVKKFIARWL